MEDSTIRQVAHLSEVATIVCGVLALLVWWLATLTFLGMVRNHQVTTWSMVAYPLTIMLSFVVTWACRKTGTYFRNRIQWSPEEIALAEAQRFGDLNAP